MRFLFLRRKLSDFGTPPPQAVPLLFEKRRTLKLKFKFNLSKKVELKNLSAPHDKRSCRRLRSRRKNNVILNSSVLPKCWS